MFTLSDRKQDILQAIIQDYLDTAEPVGSRNISKKYITTLSPATIRNEMSDLEEEGFIRQPHTSAGRIPSDKGYRFYVDSLMKGENLTVEEKYFINNELKNIDNDLDSILQNSLHVLSALSNYATLILIPNVYRSAIKVVQMVLVNIHQVMLVLLTNTGTSNIMINTDGLNTENLDQDDLNKLSKLLTEQLKGKNLEHLKDSVFQEIVKEMPSYKALLQETLDLIKRTLILSSYNKIYKAGLTNIIGQPEFSDIEHMRQVLDLFEQEKTLCDMLNKSIVNSQSDIDIKIGHENPLEQMHECSMIVTKYKVQDNPVGVFGVLGPTRMHYDRTTSILRYMSNHISNMFYEDF